LLKELRVLVLRAVEKEKIDVLKVGDFFVDSPIVFIQKRPNIVSIVTESGSVFNAHVKPGSYNVFKKNRGGGK
jgi:hypothetical protein